jgi:hypothetical protein
MKNPCGTTKANILESAEINGIKIYFGTGVNPVNSPAQFFVAWGKNVLANGLIHTFNSESPEEGFLWFVDEDEAEERYHSMLREEELKQKIAEVKKRFPYHSVQPYLIQELEELEEQLEELHKKKQKKDCP